ncbi:class I SAM-dependent methyltransferase [Nocardioides sp. GY 10127]|uniref:class I SAM-dependent methyltransferase n=1 Tax=Nocardioides sp. GY 10127 TaxID=2569762 RepID=UPI0010A76498|nr:class I SAM-dependent methyltransferase [Nocardioides sp. GY 10127]TIC82824.1 class I SAM-dependent methyltransferase [Nocardioides sp. GY 10127]
MSRGWSEEGVARAYAETFAPLCAGVHDEVLRAAGVGDVGSEGGPARRRVLDVGAGTGALAVRAAALDAEVVAVEPDPAMRELAMRELARGETARAEHPQPTRPGLDLRAGALPDLPVGDGWADATLAVFVVNHLDDPRAGVAELARVTRPGGRVVVTIWPSGQTVQGRLWEEALAEAGAVRPPGVRLPPERDFPRTEEGLAALLAGAGLVDVEARTVAWEHRCPPDTLWRGAAGGVGGIGATVRAQGPDVRARLRRAHDRLVAPLVVDGDLRLATQAVLAVGTA